MDPTSRAILLGGGGGPSGPEYIGTYKFTTPRDYNSYQWQVPAQTAYIQAVAWGAGGGGNPYNWYNCSLVGGSLCIGGNGGVGGFSTAVIPVTAGENLSIGVGNRGTNGAGSHFAGFSGGGFTGILRSSTVLLIAGGGGGGPYQYQPSGSGAYGGNGGGLTATNGTYTSYDTSNTRGYLFGATPNGGGGYQGGRGGANYGGEGGTGYIAATGNLHASTEHSTQEDIYDVPQKSHPDWIYGWGHGNVGTGLLVIHALGSGYDPANAPVIPASRTILGNY